MGGAIFNDAGDVVLINVTLIGNAAVGGNSSVGSGNGSGYGGAIFNYAGNLALSFVTMSGNDVVAGGNADGGAVYSLGDSSTECRAGFNPCASNGEAMLSMNNSVAANSSGGTNDMVVGSINSGSSMGSGNGNFIGAQSASIGTVNAPGITGPKLGSLSLPLRGGLADVMRQQPQSPLTDAAASCKDAAGNAVVTDQLGTPRPQGGTCDIGAVELVTDRIFASNFDGTGTPYP